MDNKYLFGSKMLKLNNCRDEDWIIYVNSRGREIKDEQQRSIPMCRQVISTFIEGNNVKGDALKALNLYQNSSPFFDDVNYPFNYFNILNHKPVWIDCLKSYMNDDATELRALKKEILPKTFYHILYQYYMITEDVHFISEEAKVNVQKIHDLEMPSSYFYELRDLINSLLIQ